MALDSLSVIVKMNFLLQLCKASKLTHYLLPCRGYMAPEYINRGLITTKSDIFSLGVIIIEIVTGHRDYPDENGVSPQEFMDLV